MKIKALVSLLLIVILTPFMFPIIGNVYALDNIVEVTGWKELKDTIDSQNENVKIKLKQSQNWNADSTIKINKGQQIEIISEDEIIIERDQGFKNNLIENEGTLLLGSNEMNGNIILDGNKENVISDDSLVTSISGKIEISKNFTLRNNHSTKDGAGLILKQCTANINGGVISNNTSNGTGGGIYCESSELTVNNLKILNNSATYGGGVYISDNLSTSVFNNVEVKENNTTIGSGGGIYAYGKITISGDNTIISNNTAQTFRRRLYDKS